MAMMIVPQPTPPARLTPRPPLPSLERTLILDVSNGLSRTVPDPYSIDLSLFAGQASAA